MLKYSIAAMALLATSSFALAEPMDQSSKGAGASNSAAEHAPGQMKGSGSAKDLAPGQRKEEGSSAKDLSPGHAKDSSASRSDKKNGLERKSENREGLKNNDSNRNAKNDADRDMKGKESDRNAKNDRDVKGSDTDRNAKNERLDRDDKMRREESRGESNRNGSSTGASEGTEGRSGGKGSITGVTEEQRTRVKTVFTRHHVEPARDLNVSINVGVALPHSVHLYPVPEDIVTIVPDYRGYDYIMLDDNRVAIVDPDTFEVVDIIVIA